MEYVEVNVSAIKYCSYCGTRLRAKAAFCTKCGTKCDIEEELDAMPLDEASKDKEDTVEKKKGNRDEEFVEEANIETVEDYSEAPKESVCEIIVPEFDEDGNRLNSKQRRAIRRKMERQRRSQETSEFDAAYEVRFSGKAMQEPPLAEKKEVLDADDAVSLNSEDKDESSEQKPIVIEDNITEEPLPYAEKVIRSLKQNGAMPNMHGQFFFAPVVINNNPALIGLIRRSKVITSSPQDTELLRVIKETPIELLLGPSTDDRESAKFPVGSISETAVPDTDYNHSASHCQDTASTMGNAVEKWAAGEEEENDGEELVRVTPIPRPQEDGLKENVATTSVKTAVNSVEAASQSTAAKEENGRNTSDESSFSPAAYAVRMESRRSEEGNKKAVANGAAVNQSDLQRTAVVSHGTNRGASPASRRTAPEREYNEPQRGREARRSYSEEANINTRYGTASAARGNMSRREEENRRQEEERREQRARQRAAGARSRKNVEPQKNPNEDSYYDDILPIDGGAPKKEMNKELLLKAGAIVIGAGIVIFVVLVLLPKIM